jgi:hypothetical protein
MAFDNEGEGETPKNKDRQSESEMIAQSTTASMAVHVRDIR